MGQPTGRGNSGSGGDSGESGAGAPSLSAGHGGEANSAGGGKGEVGGAPGDAGDAGADAGQGGVMLEPIDTACSGDRAFVAVSGAFVDPTPRELALSLNARIFDASPVSFVLRQADGTPSTAASYTVVEDGLHAFPSEMPPGFTPGWLREGGFGSESAQERGWLLIQLDDGPLEVPLQNLSFAATTQDGCTRGFVSMTGVIPLENADLVERLSGASSEEELPEARPSEEEVTLSALFAVDLVDFDFGNLP